MHVYIYILTDMRCLKAAGSSQAQYALLKFFPAFQSLLCLLLLYIDSKILHQEFNHLQICTHKYVHIYVYIYA